jgi:2-succinyl-6-hydroxy-2,4-cyclohexadiene-1-carboxylate synthase
MSRVAVIRNLVKLPGIEIFYRDTKTAAPAILCLHGRWGRGETWIEFMRHYGGRYRVIAPDLRGHGLSGKPVARYTAAEMASDMIALLDHLRIERAIVVGHSMGGHAAGYLAAAHPGYVRALAILDKSANGPDAPSPVALDELEIIDPETKDWPMPFASLLEAREVIRKAEGSELSYQYFMNSLVETMDGYRMLFSPQAIAANIAYYAKWYDLLPGIKCPVMLVRAKGGAAVPDDDFGKMRAMIPDCVAYEMSNPDHNVHLANAGEFYGYFDEFLARL